MEENTDKFYRIFELSEGHLEEPVYRDYNEVVVGPLFSDFNTLEEAENELADIESRNDFIILPIYTP